MPFSLPVPLRAARTPAQQDGSDTSSARAMIRSRNSFGAGRYKTVGSLQLFVCGSWWRCRNHFEDYGLKADEDGYSLDSVSHNL